MVGIQYFAHNFKAAQLLSCMQDSWNSLNNRFKVAEISIRIVELYFYYFCYIANVLVNILYQRLQIPGIERDVISSSPKHVV